jgi:hypothetical protein
MALSCACERVDHERQDVCEWKMCRVGVSRRSGLVFEINLEGSKHGLREVKAGIGGGSNVG